MENVATLSLPDAPDQAAGAADELEPLLARAWANDPQNTDQLNHALRTLKATGPESRARLGRRLLDLLESRRLALMVGTDGTCAEALAAARVLELGFPWALHLTPELLARVRQLPKATRGRPRGFSFVLSAMATGCALVDSLVGLVPWGYERLNSLCGAVAAVMLALNLVFAVGRLSRQAMAISASVALFIEWLSLGLRSSRWDSGAITFLLLAPPALSLLAAILPSSGHERVDQ